MWADVNLEAGTLRLHHQLSKPSHTPEFVPLKSGPPRTLDLSDGLVELLRTHRKHQSEVKMRNRKAYTDRGLVFAKEARVRSAERLGDPLQINNIGETELNPLIKKAGVKRIKFHGLRHTAVTLALLAGVPVKVVSTRPLEDINHRRPLHARAPKHGQGRCLEGRQHPRRIGKLATFWPRNSQNHVKNPEKDTTRTLGSHCKQTKGGTKRKS